MDDWKTFIDEIISFNLGDLVAYRSDVAIHGVTPNRYLFIGIVTDTNHRGHSDRYVVRWHRLTDGVNKRILFDLDDEDSRTMRFHSSSDLILLANSLEVARLTGVTF